MAKKQNINAKMQKYARNAQQSCSTGPEYAMNASVRSRYGVATKVRLRVGSRNMRASPMP